MEYLTIKENKKCEFKGIPKDGREEEFSEILKKFFNEAIKADMAGKSVKTRTFMSVDDEIVEVTDIWLKK